MVSLLEQIHLIELTILFLLSFYMLPDHLLIHTNRGNKIPPDPEMLPSRILSLSNIKPDNLNGPLALQKPCPLKDRILGRNRDQHMVQPQMSFSNLTLFMGGFVTFTGLFIPGNVKLY